MTLHRKGPGGKGRGEGPSLGEEDGAKESIRDEGCLRDRKQEIPASY